MDLHPHDGGRRAGIHQVHIVMELERKILGNLKKLFGRDRVARQYR